MAGQGMDYEENEDPDLFARSNITGKKRRGTTSTKAENNSKGRKKAPFASFRGNAAKENGFKGNPAWSKFATAFGPRTVTLTDKKRLLALAKLGGAKGVTESGYSILAGWLDDAVEHNVIAGVQHVLTKAAANGVKTKIFGGDMHHFEIIHSDPELLTPLNVVMPHAVEEKMNVISRVGKMAYNKNKDKINAAKPIMEAYRLAPHVSKEIYKAVKLFYKEHPGLSASSLKVNKVIDLRNPGTLLEYLQHHYPEWEVPVRWRLVNQRMDGQGAPFAVIPALNEFIMAAPAFNKYDAITIACALGTNPNNPAVYTRQKHGIKLIIARFSKLALTVAKKALKELQQPKLPEKARSALLNPIFRAMAIGNSMETAIEKQFTKQSMQAYQQSFTPAGITTLITNLNRLVNV